MSPAALKLAVAGVLALLLLTAGGVWKVQDWRYGKQLTEQSAAHQDYLTAISNAAAARDVVPTSPSATSLVVWRGQAALKLMSRRVWPCSLLLSDVRAWPVYQ